MAGEITTDLVSKLRVRIEDTNSNKYRFEDAELRDILSEAQLEIAKLLHDDYLDELTDTATDEDFSGGSVALTDINSGGILRGGEGVLGVKVSPGGSGALWATPTSVKKLKELECTFKAYSDTNIYYYTHKGYVYVLCTTLTGTTADVYYLKIPTELSTTQNPLLNGAFHNLMLDLAEAKAWLADEKPGRADKARNFAYDQIKILNAKKESK